MLKLYITTEHLTLMFKFFILMYILNNTHTLNNLITIEFMAITVTALSFIIMNMLKMELYVVMFVMILLITESILGLSILISVIRTHGNDFLKSSTLILC